MGTGIWSMHFIGMLAFSLPIATAYDIPITVASLVFAVVASGFALFTVTRRTLSRFDLAKGGLLMGVGITAMHYTGMAALMVQPAIRYHWGLFALSVAIAIGAATAALWMAFTLRANPRRIFYGKFGGAAIMGVAICGMHHTGMAAANFAPDTIGLGGVLADRTAMAGALGAITFLILCGTLALSVVDARMESRTAQMASSLRAANAELQHLVLHDTLTTLPNRLLLEDRVEQVLAECRRSGGQCAVLFVDLDRFKMLNDSLGHYAGDTVLRAVAERLRASVTPEDTVSRLGGDEFVILLRSVAQSEDAARAARNIMEALSPPVRVEPQELRISASIGIAMYPMHGDNSTRLIANADAAMYHIKKSGRSSFAFFSSEMSTFFPERLALETELRGALENNQIELFYQPKVDVRTGQIVGTEALARWNHPQRGVIMPSEFIPFAEETGLIVALGRWVLHEACAQNRAWQARGVCNLSVAVNISGVQFQQRNFVETVSYALAKSGLAPRYLELEITESVLMQNPAEAIGMLAQLARMGVNLSIDDFGTGYSSLNYLKRFPIHKLKIDQTFIRDISIDSDAAAIVHAIIALAHSLRLRVVAEGVEKQEQLNFLRVIGNDEYQGFLHSKPLPARELERHLASTASV
jgi:diguanylate cyclase (GGDEF)-like protein